MTKNCFIRSNNLSCAFFAAYVKVSNKIVIYFWRIFHFVVSHFAKYCSLQKERWGQLNFLHWKGLFPQRKVIEVPFYLISIDMWSTFIVYLFHEEGHFHIGTSPLICRANQWTGFYMIQTSVMKELMSSFTVFSLSTATIFRSTRSEVFRKKRCS